MPDAAAVETPAATTATDAPPESDAPKGVYSDEITVPGQFFPFVGGQCFGNLQTTVEEVPITEDELRSIDAMLAVMCMNDQHDLLAKQESFPTTDWSTMQVPRGDLSTYKETIRNMAEYESNHRDEIRHLAADLEHLNLDGIDAAMVARYYDMISPRGLPDGKPSLSPADFFPAGTFNDSFGPADLSLADTVGDFFGPEDPESDDSSDDVEYAAENVVDVPPTDSECQTEPPPCVCDKQ